MPLRTFQLVIQYDGEAFAGWQRQPAQRTVQGCLEDALLRLTQSPVTVTGAGRTDAGVHALGQAASIQVAEKWEPGRLKSALNAHLPRDVRCAGVTLMEESFHARFSATERQYRYLVGTDADAASPFRYNREWAMGRLVDLALLQAEAATVIGEHSFRAFAVKGTAPAADDHRCAVRVCQWELHPGGVTLVIAANRFLHHMVRYLVGTMVDVGTGRRPAGTVETLRATDDNRRVSPPAPACGLYLERVTYPLHCYRTAVPAVAA